MMKQTPTSSRDIKVMKRNTRLRIVKIDEMSEAKSSFESLIGCKIINVTLRMSLIEFSGSKRTLFIFN